MKTWMMLAGAAGALALSITAAQAQEARPYFGVQYNYVELDGGGEAKLDAVAGRLGLGFNPYLSAELRLGLGFGSDRVGGTKVELDHYYGGYVRLAMPTTTQLTPYLLGGYTRVKTDPQLRSSARDDFGYGVGVDLSLDHALALNLEYARLLDSSRVDMDALSLGFTYSF